MKRGLGLPALGLTLVLLAGCSAASRQATFLDVSHEVEHRLGSTVTGKAIDPKAGELGERADHLLAGRLGVEQAVEVALLRQPDLQAALEDLGVSRAELMQAGLSRNPIAEAHVRFLDGGPGHTVEIDLVQDVIDLATLRARRRSGEASLRAAKARAVAAAIDTAAMTREAWYRALAEEQLLGMHKVVLEAVGAGYEVARAERESAGRDRALARTTGRLPRLGLGLSSEREDSGRWSFGPGISRRSCCRSGPGSWRRRSSGTTPWR